MATNETPYYEKPMAVEGLTSYRYKGDMNWIMIGATDDADAAREAQRSHGRPIDKVKLDRWDGARYVPVTT
jgi:hypothetical protein